MRSSLTKLGKSFKTNIFPVVPTVGVHLFLMIPQTAAQCHDMGRDVWLNDFWLVLLNNMLTK